MKRSMVWFALGALFLAFASSAPGAVEASHPVNPQPLLNCSDVNGDGPVTAGDIQKVVGKFGTNDAHAAANALYHPLYDLTTPPGSSGSGAITVGDILVAVSDFGLTCPAMNGQIAQATLDIIDPNYHPPAGVPDFPGAAGLLTENATLLASKGYLLSSTDVPGQGKHYVNATFFNDNLFYPTQPDGLVYADGKLAAQLYYVDGDAVGWGCWPGPPPGNCTQGPPPVAEQVNVDAFCSPTPPNSSCSWAGSYDGWHLHDNLCTVAVGSPQAAAIPGVGSAASCEAIHNMVCGSKCAGTTWNWDDRVGWMGHLWNHLLNANVNNTDINGNGRFADCYPDTEDWTGFNCPQ
ncbi:MAG: hypothetical protein WBD55_00145 [Dehalococcoidia bacterium]